jgi:VanZ family protein
MTHRHRAAKQPAVVRRRLWQVAFAVALAVQLVVLYWPRTVSASSGLPIDKLAHALVFGAVAWTAIRAGFRPVLVVVALLVHAVVSEAAQQAFLPSRSGDVRDVLADVVGTVLAATGAVLTSRPGRGVPPVRSGSAAKLP